MNSIRKWFFKPARTDQSHLAQFYFADEELITVASELDSFDGRKDVERCTNLVNQLRHCQDAVLSIVEKIMVEVIPDKRASHDYRIKYPDEVSQENLAGQLWFGAECLAAGSSIVRREMESVSMRPLARVVTGCIDQLRSLLREQCFRDRNIHTGQIRTALIEFDQAFSEFELSYVSAMVPVKSMKEFDQLQEVTILFCETVQRALNLGLLSTDTIESFDAALMITIPRLAIVCGLLLYRDGPLDPDKDPMEMCEMFRQFQVLLYKIRELLQTLSAEELRDLEQQLCDYSESQGHVTETISLLTSPQVSQDHSMLLSHENSPGINKESISTPTTDIITPRPQPDGAESPRLNRAESSRPNGAESSRPNGAEPGRDSDYDGLTGPPPTLPPSSHITELNDASIAEYPRSFESDDLYNSGASGGSGAGSDHRFEAEGSESTNIDCESSSNHNKSNHARNARQYHQPISNSARASQVLDVSAGGTGTNLTQGLLFLPSHNDSFSNDWTEESCQQLSYVTEALCRTFRADTASLAAAVRETNHNSVVDESCDQHSFETISDLYSCDDDKIRVETNNCEVDCRSEVESTAAVELLTMSDCNYMLSLHHYYESEINMVVCSELSSYDNGDHIYIRNNSTSSKESIATVAERDQLPRSTVCNTPASSSTSLSFTRSVPAESSNIAENLAACSSKYNNVGSDNNAGNTEDCVNDIVKSVVGKALSDVCACRDDCGQNMNVNYSLCKSCDTYSSRLVEREMDDDDDDVLSRMTPSCSNVAVCDIEEILDEIVNMEELKNLDEFISTSVRENDFDNDICARADDCRCVRKENSLISECRNRDVSGECRNRDVAEEWRSDVARECRSRDAAGECRSRDVAGSCNCTIRDWLESVSATADSCSCCEDIGDPLAAALSADSSTRSGGPAVSRITSPLGMRAVESSCMNECGALQSEVMDDASSSSSACCECSGKHAVGSINRISQASNVDPDLESCDDSFSEFSSDVLTSESEEEEQKNRQIERVLKAAEHSARQEARSHFKSSSDLIHRLFVCISGVADQLQTNYASDLRHILQAVFEYSLGNDSSGSHDSNDSSTEREQGQVNMNAEQESSVVEEPSGDLRTRDVESVRHDVESVRHDVVEHVEDRLIGPYDVIEERDHVEEEREFERDGEIDCTLAEEAFIALACDSEAPSPGDVSTVSNGEEEGYASVSVESPQWIPDNQSTHCLSCQGAFSFIKRRHHCRNCGKIFCAHCTSNTVPLPQLGYMKPVRVCKNCFQFFVAPFTVHSSASSYTLPSSSSSS